MEDVVVGAAWGHFHCGSSCLSEPSHRCSRGWSSCFINLPLNAVFDSYGFFPLSSLLLPPVYIHFEMQHHKNSAPAAEVDLEVWCRCWGCFGLGGQVLSAESMAGARQWGARCGAVTCGCREVTLVVGPYCGVVAGCCYLVVTFAILLKQMFSSAGRGVGWSGISPLLDLFASCCLWG